MIRLLRTVAYWLRRWLRDADLGWTDQDQYEYEWDCWETAEPEAQHEDEDDS